MMATEQSTAPVARRPVHRLLLSLLVGLACGSAAYADGAPIVPSSLLRLLSETDQAAVVTIAADRTATTDLFIALATSSPTAHEMAFLLPLQSLPKSFHAREVPVEQFRREKCQPLESILTESREREARDKQLVRTSRNAASLLAGPLASAGLLLSDMSLGARMNSAAMGATARAVLTVSTQHTRADIYPSLQPDQLATLARIPDLPETVRRGLAAYAGRPFALIRLRLIPAPRSAAPKPPDYAQPPPPPGVHFSFVQQMAPQKDGTHGYEFPLGTGQAWANPIEATLVYVTAPATLNVEVDFPGRRRGDPEPAPEEEGTPFDEQEGVANGRQVYAAMYEWANPARDVAIRLRPTGASPLVRAQAAAHRGVIAKAIAFPVLAMLASLISWWLLLRRRAVRPAAQVRALAAMWLVSLGMGLSVLLTVLALPMVVFGLLALGVRPGPLLDPLTSMSLLAKPLSALSGVLALALLIGLWCGLLWAVEGRTRPASERRLWRLPLAAVLSAALYWAGSGLLGMV